MHETRTEAEVLESLGCAETAEQARFLMGLERVVVAGLSPIRRLQLAILLEAIEDVLVVGANGHRAEREQALAWIAGSYRDDPETPDVSTFEGCCEGLGLSAAWLRGLIASGPTMARKMQSRTAGTTTRVCGVTPRRGQG